MWQWLKNEAKLVDGRVITPVLYEEIKVEEIVKIKQLLGEDTALLKQAVTLFDALVLQDDFNDFLTTQAYNLIN